MEVSEPIRYEVLEDSAEVKKRIGHALFHFAEVSLSIRFAGVYKGTPPIPPEIEHLSEVTCNILDAGRSEEGLRATGYTPGNAIVTVIIPRDESRQSTLWIFDPKQHTSSVKTPES